MSSLMGGVNFAISAVVSAVVSSFDDIGPQPMAFTICISICLSAAALYGLAMPRKARVR